MKDYSYKLPFDRYQRYYTCNRLFDVLINSCSSPCRLIIDVGGRDGAFFSFIQPGFVCIVADREVINSDHNVLYLKSDAVNLPFVNKCIDISLSLDTIEHIIPAGRESFICELQRITVKHLILSYPHNCSENKHIEKLLYNMIKIIQKQEDVFLKQHIQNSLPSVQEIKGSLSDDIKEFMNFGANNIYLWFLMSLLKRMYSFYGYDIFLSDISTELDLFYNRYLAENDNIPPFYRLYSIISFLEQDEKTKKEIESVFKGESTSMLGKEDLPFFVLNYAISALKTDSDHINNLYNLMKQYENHFEGFHQMIRSKDQTLSGHLDLLKALEESHRNNVETNKMHYENFHRIVDEKDQAISGYLEYMKEKDEKILSLSNEIDNLKGSFIYYMSSYIRTKIQIFKDLLNKAKTKKH